MIKCVLYEDYSVKPCEHVHKDNQIKACQGGDFEGGLGVLTGVLVQYVSMCLFYSNRNFFQNHRINPYFTL